MCVCVCVCVDVCVCVCVCVCVTILAMCTQQLPHSGGSKVHNQKLIECIAKTELINDLTSLNKEYSETDYHYEF